MYDTIHNVLDNFIYTFKQFTGEGGRGWDYERVLDGSVADTDMPLSLSTDLYRLNVVKKGNDIVGKSSFDIIGILNTSKNQIFPSYVMVSYTNDSEGKARYSLSDVHEVAPIVSAFGVMWVSANLVDDNRP